MAFVMLALLAAVVVGVQMRADAFRGRFVALGPLTLGEGRIHGLLKIPAPAPRSGKAGDLARRPAPSRDVRRHPLVGERSNRPGPDHAQVRRHAGTPGRDGGRHDRAAERPTPDARKAAHVEVGARLRRFGHQAEHLTGRLAELERDDELRHPDAGRSSLGWLREHTGDPDRSR